MATTDDSPDDTAAPTQDGTTAEPAAPTSGDALTAEHRPETLAPTSEGLPIDNGTITVSETVVAKIAALAAREVAGVHSLGLGAARSVTSVRDRIPGAAPSATSGVSVEVGRTQAAVDLDIVVEYGTPITTIARNVRRQVIASVEQLTGLQVVEVNITVDDVNLPALVEGRDSRLL